MSFLFWGQGNYESESFAKTHSKATILHNGDKALMELF